MMALTYDQLSNKLELNSCYPVPQPKPGEALIQVIVAQICSTDLEIVKGYVPNFSGVLGHEFVGRVVACESKPEMLGQRVVSEINCNDGGYSCADALFQRNHAPGRSVLGIINRDGCLAEYVAVPVANLHVVPEGLRDNEAAFAEPLAAAARIVEQGLVKPGSSVAVIGDGKLGLLCAAVLAAHSEKLDCKVTLIGRHASKMGLVAGLAATVVLPRGEGGDEGGEADVLSALEGKFDVVIEASGSATGISSALKLCRPLGTLVLKSTVSVSEGGTQWAAVANDVVVNEKVLVGSRCGPMDVALRMLDEHPSLRGQVNKMVWGVRSMEDAVQAMADAATKGAIKVQVRMPVGAA
ncbi:hypothetical protein FOA52_002174 [Chlamydomonas sp. UWO 241]|nr:hypothetical protein FOA52_002174 [Chlamydomonas sp. UWO 241]